MRLAAVFLCKGVAFERSGGRPVWVVSRSIGMAVALCECVTFDRNAVAPV
jgi:hypothetical protein